MNDQKTRLIIYTTQVIILILIIIIAYASTEIAHKIRTMEEQACHKNNAQLYNNVGINLVCKDQLETFTINRFGDRITPKNTLTP